MATGLGQFIHVIPVLAPTSGSAGDDTVSAYVDMLEFTDLEFHVLLGTLDSSGVTVVSLAPYASSTTTAAGAVFPFTYVETGAVGTDTMGSWAASTAAVDMTSDDSAKVVILKVDPSEVAMAGTDKRYVYLNVDLSTGDNTDYSLSAVAYGIPRHKQAAMQSSSA